MLKSLFSKYIERFFPQLQRLIETVNKKRGNLTYLYREHLREEYSPDNKWESTTADTTFVAADFVSMDSKLPIKQRDSIQTANGKLPKVGISRVLKETDITALNIMESQGGNAQLIARKLANDPVACATGIDERNEFNFLYGFSNGYVAIKDEDSPNALMRINFNYFEENKFGSSTKGTADLEDILDIIEKAAEKGTAVQQIWCAKTAYDALRRTQKARELAANYESRIVASGYELPVPTPEKFNAAFADETGGVTFVVVNRAIYQEVNGVRTAVKPWNANRFIFAPAEIVGTLIYGRLAEQTNPVENVIYQLVDNYKLIARFRETNPLRETTTGQAIVCPVIENVDQIFIYDISEGQEVDTDAETADTEDEFVTVWGYKYGKTEFVNTANTVAGTNLKVTSTDAAIVKAVNKLSEAEQAAIKAAIVSYPSVSPAELNFSKSADSTGKQVTVTTSDATGLASATATTTDSWITPAISGNKVTVKVAANSEASAPAREGTVTVTVGTKTATITVKQAANT